MHTRFPSRRFRLPLHIHISTLFFLLVLIAGGSIAWVSYNRSVQMLERAAGDLMARVAAQTLSETERLLQPVGASVRLAALQRVSGAASLAERRNSLPFLRRALASSEAASSIYAGYANGDFFLLFRIIDEEARTAINAPPGAAWLVQSIEHPQGGAQAEAHFIYLDAGLRVLRDDLRPDFAASYDPRQRSWYRRAAASDVLIYTEPYVFATTGKAGISVAQRSEDGQAVVAADIRLASLAATLQGQKLTPDSRLVIFDADRRVVASSEPGWLRSGPSGSAPERRRIDELGGALAALGQSFPAAANLVQGAPLADFVADGRDWRGAVVALPISGGPPAFLGVAVPDDELLTDARDLRDKALLATLAVMLLALPLTYLGARLVSRPLRELVDETAAIRRFDFDDDVATRSVVCEVDDLATDLASMKSAIRHFLHIAASMAEEPDFDRLLPKLVDETVAVVGARAGALYLTRDDEGLDLAALRESDGICLAPELAPPGADMAGLVAAGQRSCVGTLKVSAGAGSPCASLFEALQVSGAEGMAYLAVPLMDRAQDRLGLLILWFDEAPAPDLIHFVEALSGSAAVSVETRALIRAQKALFESFIQLLAGAIDAKSPYTAGHCARVPELTKMIARAACEAGDGPFRDFRLSDDDWEAVHIAAWLHDCGKVTTPEYVVDKATKLETIHDRIHEIRMRFEVLKRDAEIACWRAIAGGADEGAEEARRAAAWATLDEEFAFVASCNEGGEEMAGARIERLQQIAERRWLRTLDDRLGVSPDERRRMGPAPALPVLEALIADKPEHRFARGAEDVMPEDNPWGFRLKVPALLYNRGELANLSITRGTLSEEDRFKINEHIVQTIRMLAELPFPRHLKAVPEIAGGHHEKMDGSGYPRGLSREQMSPVARMMAVADIFEALTAIDRPYKKGKTLSEAVAIMARMRDEGHIDPDIFALFLRSGVYRQYAERFMQRAYIDEVDVESVL
jgi:HD-GYP domain-containing protein (c-di-GMP phosphodiesterase class II)